MNIHTLRQVPIPVILETFNRAFSDYVVPFQQNLEQLENRIVNDNIDLDLSVGAFEHDRLIGFILHGKGKIKGEKVLYNGGTGVIPEKRGQHITEQLYAYIRPQLKQQGYSKCILEVVDSNAAAIKSYEKIGFRIHRALHCYRGMFSATDTIPKVEVEELISHDHSLEDRFGDWEPAWQNSTEAVLRSAAKNKTFVLLEKHHIIGYVTFNPATGRIAQFAIDRNYRRQHFGTALFKFVAEQVEKEIVLINTDGEDTATDRFLEHIGMKKFIRQLEMELIL